MPFRSLCTNIHSVRLVNLRSTPCCIQWQIKCYSSFILTDKELFELVYSSVNYNFITGCKRSFI
jgi:hypothetical protein